MLSPRYCYWARKCGEENSTNPALWGVDNTGQLGLIRDLILNYRFAIMRDYYLGL